MTLHVQMHGRQDLLNKSQKEHTWRMFVNGGTTHSANALTLPYIINRCEKEQIPYELTAQPGLGYHIKPIPKVLDTPK